MKLCKRMLAMLAVIAIMISGFAFAEEPAPIIELLEIAAEEVVAAGEAETPEEAPAEEAVPAEEMEAPADEEPAEAAAAESDQHETIDVPVVYSLFHRDEVPGDCTHPNEWLEYESKWNVEVLASDSRTHTIRYQGEEIYFCPDCGYEYYLPIESWKEISEPHNWDGDYCWTCGYMNPCTHENLFLAYTSKWDITVLSTTATTHTISCRTQDRYDCPDCGIYRWEENAGYQTITEAHDWNENASGSSYCWICEYVNACPHDAKNIEHENRYDQNPVSFDGKTHTLEFRLEVLFECLQCGFRGWEIFEEKQTVTELHDWFDGRCWVCDAENLCTHENAYFEPYVGKVNVEVIRTTDSEHTISYNKRRFFNCPDCGEVSHLVGSERITATEPHEWYEGRCDACGAENSCAHGNLMFDGSGRISEVLISYDEDQHTVVCFDRTWYHCRDCGETLHKDSSELYTVTEPHQWWDGRCEFCPAVNPCTHENRYLDYISTYMLELLNTTATEHSILYQDEILYVCPDCGQNSWEMQDEVKTMTAPHDWWEGVCQICEFVNPCAHKHAIGDGYHWRTERIISTTDLKHVAEMRKVNSMLCEDCGESVQVPEEKISVRAEAHEWDEYGKCYVCEYRTACLHPNNLVNSYYDYFGRALAVDSATHSLTFYLCEETSCPDCGYREVRQTEEQRRIQNHDFDENGSCWACGYQNSCNHKDTYTAKGIWYRDCEKKNSRTHITTFDTITRTFCSDCGAELSRKTTGEDPQEESHYFNAANICAECGYEASCKHEKKEKAVFEDAYSSPYDVDSHIISYETYISYSCTSCGCFLNNYSVNKVTATKLEKHSFEDGQCIECGLREVKCIHKYDKNGKCILCGKQLAEGVTAIRIPESLSLCAGEEYQLSPELVPAGADAKLKYSSSKSSVAGVSSKGTITAKAGGEAIITVEAENGISAECIVTVMKAPSKVSLNETKLTMGAGETFQLSGSVPEGSLTRFSWKSSKASVASVSATGLVTAHAAGKATITVETLNGKKATCTITVKKAPTEISLNESALTLSAGETAALKATITKDSASIIRWSVSGDAVTVADGVITAVKEGEATVTASTGNGLSASCTVRVLPAPTHVLLAAESLRMSVNQSVSLEARAMAGENETAGKLSYSSSNTKVAIVSADGVVTGKKAGEVVVTVKAANGVSAACSVTVIAAPTKVGLSAKSATIGAGETFELYPSYSSEEALTSFSYSTSNSKVCAIEQVGDACIVTALKAGKANITIKTHNGKSAKCAITVKAAPESISLSETALVLGEGQSTELTVSLPKNTAAQIIWSSDSDAVLAAGGNITAVKAGTATVYATTKNGLASASCTVTVKPAPTAVAAEDMILVVGQKQAVSAKLVAGDEVYAGACSAELVSGKGVVTISGGSITAKKAGTAVIIFTAYNGVSADCTVTVYAAPKSVKLSASKKTLAVGESFELTASLSPANAYSEGYSVSMDKEGLISLEGEDGVYSITALKAGKVKLTIAASNDKKTACTITIK